MRTLRSVYRVVEFPACDGLLPVRDQCVVGEITATYFITIAFVALFGTCRRMSSPWPAAATMSRRSWRTRQLFHTDARVVQPFHTIVTMAALMRFATTNHRRWLAVAGLCAGLSSLFKCVGLYAVATAALFALFHEQQRIRSSFMADADHILPFLGGAFFIPLVMLTVAIVRNVQRTSRDVTVVAVCIGDVCLSRGDHPSNLAARHSRRSIRGD